MLWMIISLIVLIALLVVHFGNLKFLQPEKKPYIMAGMVFAMLALCIIDELTIPDKNQINHKLEGRYQQQHRQMVAPFLNISNDLYWNFPSRAIIKQERVLLDYLTQMHRNSEPTILLIKEIDPTRFRAVFKEFQKNQNGGHKQALTIDFRAYNFKIMDLEEQFASKQDHITYFIPQGVSSFQHFDTLYLLYHKFNTSIILLDVPPLLFPFSSIHKYTTIYNFNNNWVPQVLQHHPPRLVQLCNKYRTIDYKFYLLSQSEPLSQLCGKLLSSKLTECIKQNLGEHAKLQSWVAYSKVRHCWPLNSGYTEGVLINNGMVSLKKDYFYSGKINEQIFAEHQYSNENL